MYGVISRAPAPGILHFGRLALATVLGITGTIPPVLTGGAVGSCRFAGESLAGAADFYFIKYQ